MLPVIRVPTPSVRRPNRLVESCFVEVVGGEGRLEDAVVIEIELTLVLLQRQPIVGRRSEELERRVGYFVVNDDQETVLKAKAAHGVPDRLTRKIRDICIPAVPADGERCRSSRQNHINRLLRLTGEHDARCVPGADDLGNRRLTVAIARVVRVAVTASNDTSQNDKDRDESCGHHRYSWVQPVASWFMSSFSVEHRRRARSILLRLDQGPLYTEPP